MQGERREFQVNHHNTNQVTTRKKPSNNSATIAEGDALDRNMDAITSKLGMLLKMLEPMLAYEKKYNKVIFDSHQQPIHKDSHDRQQPPKEDQGEQHDESSAAATTLHKISKGRPFKRSNNAEYLNKDCETDSQTHSASFEQVHAGSLLTSTLVHQARQSPRMLITIPAGTTARTATKPSTHGQEAGCPLAEGTRQPVCRRGHGQECPQD